MIGVRHTRCRVGIVCSIAHIVRGSVSYHSTKGMTYTLTYVEELVIELEMW